MSGKVEVPKDGFVVFFSDGTYLEFPTGRDSVPAVIDWFRDAAPGEIIRLATSEGLVISAQKRHIARIAVWQ